MKVTTFKAVSRLRKLTLLGLVASVLMMMSAPVFAATTVTVVAGNPTHLSEFRINDPVSGAYTYGDITINVTVQSTEMGEVFSFSSSAPVTRAVAKGGTDGATVYDYDPAVMSGSDLHAPLNPSGKYADLSWIGFSFGEAGEPGGPEEPEEPEEPLTPEEPEEPLTPQEPEAPLTPEEPEEPSLPFTEEEEEPFLPFTGGPPIVLLGAAAAATAGAALRKIGK